LWPVVAGGGDGFDKQRVREIVGRYEELADDPVRALVAAAADADLVVVGSRGLHGLKSLGSVSERVAHDARCSTLVVRGS
jgi:nucleotide-binding universal stress UspA family protein